MRSRSATTDTSCSWLRTQGQARPTTAWIRVWRLGPHPKLARTIHVHGFVSWAAWSPDGRTLVATASSADTVPGTQHGFVSAWDASTGRPLWTTPFRHGYPLDVAFAPGERTLAVSGYEMGAAILDSSSGRVERRMPVSGGLYAFGVAFSPDGTKLASTDSTGSLDFWNPKTGKRLATIPDPDQAVGQSVSWSPDGRTIALTDWGNTLRLFDVATRTEIGSPFQLLVGQPYADAYAAYTPDGKNVIVSDVFGQTWVVPVTLTAWEAAACRVAGRNLTRTEWNDVLPGRPYRRLCP